MRITTFIACLFLASCTTRSLERATFTVGEFEYLRFLEGRWEGTGPDGSLFYEMYSFPSRTKMHSTRFKDSSFAEANDGSVVKLEQGVVTSAWNEFRWRASELAPGKACFLPVAAPGSFCWEQVSASEVRVIQRWTDEQGKPQEYAIPLRRP